MMDWPKRLYERIFRSQEDAESDSTRDPSRMEWRDKWIDYGKRRHEPLFRSGKDAETYVNRELAGAVPEGWVVRRFPDQQLTWTIEKEGSTQDYTVQISKGLDIVILLYSNNSAGGMSLHHVLLRALVIDAVELRLFPLGECLRFLFANHDPNE